MLATVQPCWIVVQRFPALLSAIHLRRVLRHCCLPAWVSPSPQGQIGGATCTPRQKHSGLTQQNCLLKACFHDFQQGLLPDLNGTLDRKSVV